MTVDNEARARVAALKVWEEEEAKGTPGPEQAQRFYAALRGARFALESLEA